MVNVMGKNILRGLARLAAGGLGIGALLMLLGPAGSALAQQFNRRGMSRQEHRIATIRFKQRMDDAKGDGDVGAWPDSQMQIRLACQRCRPRVNNN